MSLRATIFKADVDLFDIDRTSYQNYSLILARHPSETNERMMVRLLAFLHHADVNLKFTKGLSETSEPDLWLKDMTGEVRKWIEVGLPDAKRLNQISRKGDQVIIYAYGHNASSWWKKTEKRIEKLTNLSVFILPKAITDALMEIADRSMRLICSIQDEQIYLTDKQKNLHIDLLSCKVRTTNQPCLIGSNSIKHG